MSKFTPSLNAKGIYRLKAPFENISTKVYQCVAIRSFKDYLDKGESAFDLVYAPNTLSEAEYQADKKEGANIITLASDNEKTILVPDTYIEKYPDLEYVQYSNLVVAASLGPLPDEMSLELLKEQVAGVISDVIGVTPVVYIHASGSSGVITLAEHDIKETTRLAAVTNRDTDRARLIAANELIAKLQQQIIDLEDAIQAMP